MSELKQGEEIVDVQVRVAETGNCWSLESGDECEEGAVGLDKFDEYLVIR